MEKINKKIARLKQELARFERELKPRSERERFDKQQREDLEESFGIEEMRRDLHWLEVQREELNGRNRMKTAIDRIEDEIGTRGERELMLFTRFLLLRLRHQHHCDSVDQVPRWLDRHWFAETAQRAQARAALDDFIDEYGGFGSI